LNPLETWRRKSQRGLRVTWLGHSTVLIEIEGVRILTDPVWGPRASPLSLAGPKRFQPVPVTLREMPPVDIVIVSHDHYDHLDYPTIRALAKTDVPFVTSLGVGAHLEGWGVQPERITELDWWESFDLPTGGVQITAAPSQHFSGRTLGQRNATLWSSFVVRSANHGVFFSGDTGLTTEYAAIREKLGPFDLVMLEVGAWHPAWGDMHLGPENALKARALLAAARSFRCIGARSASRCTHGTSPPRSSTSRPEEWRAPAHAATRGTGRAGDRRGSRDAVVANRRRGRATRGARGRPEQARVPYSWPIDCRSPRSPRTRHETPPRRSKPTIRVPDKEISDA
jgi:L-ascorbate metabolism protein UlaG (beta-lactamase superfamily)